MSKDYYKILGVEKNASAEEIKKAFYKLAHQHHPDKAGGNEAKFKEVNEAYQVLSNKEKRAQYDQFGQTFNGAGAGPGGFNGAQGFGGFDINDLGDIFGSFGDMFGFGGGNSQTNRTRRGDDLQMSVEIEFLQAVFGAEKLLKFKKHIRCKHCNASGVEPGSKVETCSTCKGTGRVNKIQRTIFGAMQTQAPCEACHGTGKKISQYCRDCRGSGVVKDNVELDIKIPAGINDGETIRYSGQGEAGQEGAPAGDLYITFRVNNDSRWKRDGYDIKSILEITYSEAVFGVKKEIETVDGREILKIPDGTPSGKIFTIKGKGVNRLKGSGRGDHLVEVVVKIPTTINRTQKKLLEELQAQGL